MWPYRCRHHESEDLHSAKHGRRPLTEASRHEMSGGGCKLVVCLDVCWLMCTRGSSALHGVSNKKYFVVVRSLFFHSSLSTLHSSCVSLLSFGSSHVGPSHVVAGGPDTMGPGRCWVGGPCAWTRRSPVNPLGYGLQEGRGQGPELTQV